MTRADLETWVRRAVRDLPPTGAEVAGQRALNRKVWVWSNLTTGELERLIGAARVVALLEGA